MKNDKIMDLLTGVILGALVGLHYSLVEYHTILVVVGLFLGLKFLKVVK